MTDQAKIERVLKLITLLSGSFGYSLKELADRLGTTTRTVYRYIQTLKNAGFIVEKNSDGYWKLERQDKNNRDLHDLLQFTEEESYILQKAIHSIDDNNVLKSNLIKKLYSLYDSKRVIDTIIKKEKSEVIARLTEAILKKRQVKIMNYSSAQSGTVTDRLVEPIQFTTNFVSVWCYEPGSGKNKLFKTARIGQVLCLDTPRQYEKQHKPGFIDCFRISSDRKIPVKIILTMRARNLLIEEYPLAEKDIRERDDGMYLLETQVCDYRGVGRFVLGLPDETEVIEPHEFKDYLKAKKTSSIGY